LPQISDKQIGKTWPRISRINTNKKVKNLTHSRVSR